MRVFRVSAQTVAAAMLFMLAGLLPVQGLLGGGLAPSRGVAASASRAAVDMKVFDWKVRDAPAPELETITLGSLKTAPGSHQKKKRKGRGVSAGQGVTCGFGNRGQKARAGSGTRPGFEGGQTPLYRRLPKWVGKPTGPGHTKKVYGLVKVSPPRTLFRRGTHPTQIQEYARSMQQLAPAMPTHPARCRALPLHPSAPTHLTPPPRLAALDAQHPARGQHGRLRGADREQSGDQGQIQAQEGCLFPGRSHRQGPDRQGGSPADASAPALLRSLRARTRARTQTQLAPRLLFAQAHAFTASAKAAIEENGGTCVVLSPTTQQPLED